MGKDCTLRTIAAFVVLGALASTAACAADPSAGPSGAGPTQEKYFPDSEFTELYAAEEFVPVFVNDLRSLHEPVIYNRRDLVFACRVTLLTSFRGRQVLRIEQKISGATSAVYKVQQPGEDQEHLRLSVFHPRFLRRSVRDIVASVERADFFSMSNKQEVVATDGNALLVEVLYRGQYHAVYRNLKFAGRLADIARVAAKAAHVGVGLNE